MEREWQQTSVGFGKTIIANDEFINALEKENITEFPAKPTLPDVARFEYFTKGTEKQEGVWLFRNGALRFALPITVGTKPAIADYLPCPIRTQWVFRTPVEEQYPSFVPFLTLSDGQEYHAASDGVDILTPGPDGQLVEIYEHQVGQDQEQSWRAVLKMGYGAMSSSQLKMGS